MKLLSSLKFTALALVFGLVWSFGATHAQAALNCDADNDGYITLSAKAMKEVNPDVAFNSNGNYSSLEWKQSFETYKKAASENLLTAEETCDNLNFKRGAEPARCDTVIVDSASGVYDTSKLSQVEGSQVNPDNYDIPGNGLDENCDGQDGSSAVQTAGVKDLGNLTERILFFLSRAVIGVSVLVLIWGGILYSTAAGEEQKTLKARKAMVGAVIGLLVGLLAPTIVNFIAASLA